MTIKNITRSLLKKSPLSHLYHYKYNYNFTPSQIAYLVKTITETIDKEGIFLEIGCAYGNTTVFLNKHIDILKKEKKYICIDTFNGFTELDINHEVLNRDKNRDFFSSAFRENSKLFFDKTMKYNNINRVVSYQSDISDFDISQLGKISFCLFDVDLYRPTASVLPKLYNSLADGGLIIVDDCMADNRFDGAYQAYMEFCEIINKTPVIVEGKLGLIIK